MGRAVGTRPSSLEQRAVLAAAAAVAALTVVWPLGALVHGALFGAASADELIPARTWTLFARSVALALGVLVGTLLLGVPAGVALARARRGALRAALCLHLLPLALPPSFLALGAAQLVGPGSAFSSVLLSKLLYGPAGFVFVMSIALAPVVSAMTWVGLASLDPSLEEAARLVASRPLVLAKVLLPASAPFIALALVLVFSLTLSELAVPSLLRVDVYSAAVFARLGGFRASPREALLVSLPIVAVSFVLLALAHRLFARVAGDLVLRRESGAGTPLGPLLMAHAAVAAVLGLTPLVALVARGAGSFSAAVPWLGASVWNGLRAAIVTALAATAIGVPLGHAVARGLRWARVVDACLLVGFFAPAVLLALGVVQAWNGGLTTLAYQSFLILPIGLVGRYGALAVRTFAVSTRGVAEAYEDAAELSGHGYLARLVRITVPLQWRALLAAFGLVLTFCLRDVETSILYYPPGGEPLTVRLFTLEANGSPGVVCALASMHVLATALALAVPVWLVRRGQ